MSNPQLTPGSFSFDPVNGLKLADGTGIALDDPRAFSILSEAWLRAGWNTKYVYGFSWLGRPIIQLPEDMIKIQEVIYQLKPDVIVETGVAHGGSLIFYASICNAIGNGRVIGIDIEIRPHNRNEIERHKMSPFITLIEGSSTDLDVFNQVKSKLSPAESVLVILDSNHMRDHVFAELQAYSSLVTPNSFIVVCDGIMKQVVGALRTSPDWYWNNPLTAIDDFLDEHPEFSSVEPMQPFNEGLIKQRVTYWPRAFLRRHR